MGHRRALVAAMIVVGTMGLVFRTTGGSDRLTERTPASAPAQTR